MALEKHSVVIPLSGGLREDVDPFLVEAPFALALENCEFDKDGVLTKSPGSRAVTVTGVPSGLTPAGLFVDGDTLCQNTYGEGTQVLAEDHTRWRTPHEAAIVPTEARCSVFMAGDDSIVYTDVAYVAGFECFVYEQAGLAYWLVRERATGAICVGPTVLEDVHTTAPRPKVCAFNDRYFMIAANEETDGVIIWLVDTLSLPLALSADTRIAGVTADSLKDIEGTTLAWAYLVLKTAAGTWDLHRIGVSGTAPFSADSDSIAVSIETAAICWVEAEDVVFVATANDSTAGANNVRTYSSDEQTLALVAGATFASTYGPAAGAPDTRRRIAVAIAEDGASTLAVIWSTSAIPNSGTAHYSARKSMTEFRLTDHTGADLGGDLDVLKNCVLVSRGFHESGGGAACCIAWDWQSAENAHTPATETLGSSKPRAYSLQNVGMVVEVYAYTSADPETGVTTARDGWRVLARYHVDKARAFDDELDTGSTAPDRYVRRVASVGDSSWIMASEQVVERLGGGVLEKTGSSAISALQDIGRPTKYVGGVVEIDLTPRPLRSVQADNAPALSGGYAGYFDGLQAFESAPHVRPERPNVTGTAGTTNLYRYAIVYSWEDARGNLHRSAPSEPSRLIQIENANSVTVRYSMPPPTALAFKFRRQILVEIYRTQNLASGGTPRYQRIFRGAPTVDGTDPMQGVYTDAHGGTNSADTGLPLYTDSGELEAEAPPALLDIAAHGNRLFGISGDDPNTVWFTKLMQQAIAPEWNGNLTIRVTGEGGQRLTAIESLDEKIVFFKTDEVYFTNGDGPNNVGGGASYPEPQIIVGAPGCVNRNSVVRTPFGVFYHARSGIHVLDRALSTQYVGGPIEDTLAAADIRRGIYYAGKQQVHYYLSTDVVLVFDLQRKQWGKRTSRAARDAVVWLGAPVRVTSGYLCLAEDDTIFVDDGNARAMSFSTSWLRPAGLQNFKRLWRSLFLGKWFSNSGIRVTTEYDYVSSGSEQRDWSSTELTALGAATRMQLEQHHATQKCEAVRFTFTEIGDIVDFELVPPTGRGFTISALTLVLGMKPGGRFKKLAAAARK